MKQTLQVIPIKGSPYLIDSKNIFSTGASGTVSKAYNIEFPSQQLVVKTISSLSLPKDHMSKLINIPSHSNLVRYVDIQSDRNNQYFVVMEYCNRGSLQNYVLQTIIISEQSIWEILRSICKGYQVLYRMGIVHGNMKFSNILLHDGKFKLSDYSLKAISAMESYKQLQVKDVSHAKDVFALGVILYQLCYNGELPSLKDCSLGHLWNQQQQNRKQQLFCPQRSKRGERRSQLLISLIKAMLVTDVKTRITWDQIFKYPQLMINEILPKNNGLSMHLQSTPSQSIYQSQFEQCKIGLQLVEKSTAKISIITRVVEDSSELVLIEFLEIINNIQLKTILATIFRGKVINTVIDIVNLEIVSALNNIIEKSIIKLLNDIVSEGLNFSQFVLTISKQQLDELPVGIGEQLRKLIGKDLQMILETKKGRLESLIKQTKKVDHRLYESKLYNFLTIYIDLSKPTRQILAVIALLLTDLYDACIKFHTLRPSSQQTQMDQICSLNMTPYSFSSFMSKRRKSSQDNVLVALQRVGLMYL